MLSIAHLFSSECFESCMLHENWSFLSAVVETDLHQQTGIQKPLLLLQRTFLAPLFFKKKGGIALALASSLSSLSLCKTWHFAISLLLLKIFTWNSEYVFTIQKAVRTIKADNSKCFFFFRIMTLFPLRLFILYQAPHSRELAHACSALVSLILQDFLKLKLRQALIGQTR